MKRAASLITALILLLSVFGLNAQDATPTATPTALFPPTIDAAPQFICIPKDTPLNTWEPMELLFGTDNIVADAAVYEVTDVSNGDFACTADGLITVITGSGESLKTTTAWFRLVTNNNGVGVLTIGKSFFLDAFHLTTDSEITYLVIAQNGWLEVTEVQFPAGTHFFVTQLTLGFYFAVSASTCNDPNGCSITVPNVPTAEPTDTGSAT